MNKVDIRIKHLKKHFTHNNKHNSSFPPIRRKLEELAKGLSVLLTSTLDAIKNLVIKCSIKAFDNNGINYF